MDASSINKEYIEIVKNHDYRDDFLKTIDKVKHSNAVYKGKPIPFLYHPMFFTEDDIINFKKITQNITSISNKVINHYVQDKAFRTKFNFSPLLEKLILIDHGYKTNVPMGRFDLFYNGNDFKFCELNTDGSSAMNEDNTLARILLETKAIEKLKENYDLSYFDSIHPWVDESISIYREFSNSNENPVVAIVDFNESATTAEFYEFKKAYEEKGYQTLICDCRDLKYQNGKLTYEGQVIDLIYRRVVTRDLIDRSDEIEDFIQAYIDQAVCVVGPIKSQIMHNKIIFKILHEDETLNLLTDEEQEFVKKHIPKTKLFESADDFNEVLNNQNQYILKPCDLYGSRGVYVGLDHSKDEWEQLLKQYLNQDYLYQEFVHPYERDFIKFDENNVSVEPFKTITGLYIYNEKLTGLYTRIGDGNIISGLHNYYTLPNVYVKGKK